MAAVSVRLLGCRRRFAGLALLVNGWCSMLAYCGLHSRHLDCAATAGHIAELRYQESTKKAVLACVEDLTAWPPTTYLDASQL
jgi:hypothetical protein